MTKEERGVRCRLEIDDGVVTAVEFELSNEHVSKMRDEEVVDLQKKMIGGLMEETGVVKWDSLNFSITVK